MSAARCALLDHKRHEKQTRVLTYCASSKQCERYSQPNLDGGHGAAAAV
jgi:hypothetical protein